MKASKPKVKVESEPETEIEVKVTPVEANPDEAAPVEVDPDTELGTEPLMEESQSDIPAEITDQPSVKHSRRSFKFYVAITTAILVLLGASWILSSVYLSKITIGSKSILAHSSDKAVADVLSRQASAYRLTIKYPDDTTKKYPMQQLGLKPDPSSSVRSVRKSQQLLANRFLWWRPLKASVVFHKNDTALNNFIANEVNVTAQPSKDATLTIVNGDIRITDAVAGKQYGLNRPQVTLLAAAGNLRPAAIKLKTLTVHPALTAKALEAYKPGLEKTLSQSAGFTIGDKVVTPSPADIANWLEITPDDKSKKVDITVNSGKVQEYINNAARADVFPARAQVEVVQPDGSHQVLVAGTNGRDVLNKTAVATSVSKTLLSGSGFNFSMPVNYEPFQTIIAQNYDKWIEVDLTNKRMYAYEKANLVKTELVTAGAPSSPTVTGQYAIYSKFPQQDMRGGNVDGSRYFQPHVRWINYFYKDYAIHGNYWRPLNYFGNINSSHGCVSSVDSEAEWMFSWAPIGTPVIVHT